jgi:hypothetical protein
MEVMAGAVRSGEEALEEVSADSAAVWAVDSAEAGQAEDGRIKYKSQIL